MDETNRTVPHSTDAEKSVLGSILLSSLAAEKALEVLNAEDFFSVAHRDIFSAMQALYNSGKLIDNVTLVDMLERQGKLDSAGGMGYIAELAIYTPSAANIEHYISIVEGHSMRRRLISVGSGIAQDAAGSEKETALAGIDALAAFIKEIGLPTTFSELGIPANTDFRAIADSTVLTAGCCKKLTHDEIYDILCECK